MKRTVLIIEPSEIIYRGLSSIIEDSTSLNVLQQVDNVNNLEGTLTALKPDMAIVNPTLFQGHKNESGNPMVGSGHNIPTIALVYQYIEPDVLQQYDAVIDIRDAASKIARIANNSYNDKNEEQQESYELSDREKDVLVLIAKGMMSKEIADSLNISVHTVISHRKNITRKTGIKSIAGLVAFALLNNLIDSSEIE